MLASYVNKSWFAQKMKTTAFQGRVGVSVSQNIQPKNCNVAGNSFLFLRAFAFIVINHLKLTGKYIYQQP